MMQVAVFTRAPSVRRTLEAIVHAAGHQLAEDAANATLALVDAQHPAQQPPAPGIPTLTLVAGSASGDHEIGCPLRPDQLQQRLMAYRHSQTITLGNGWTLDGLARALTHDAYAAIALTEKECTLLATLAGAHPNPLARGVLLAQVWGMGSDVDTHTLETHIYRLRNKLAAITPPVGDIVTENGAYQWISTPAVIKA